MKKKLVTAVDLANRKNMSTNRELYHFDDFTLEQYSVLLDFAKEKFNFCDYSNCEEKDNFIIWRHDVDFSIHAALDLAKIENEKGIISNYFILLHSEFYNVFEKEIYEIILNIAKLGHFISLHFDSSFYKIENILDLEQALNFESSILEKLINTKVLSFSFHNPSVRDLTFEADNYAGLNNTYSSFFKKEVGYCSDSNGYWRFKRLKEYLILPDMRNLQILTHPEWWRKEVMSPLEKVNYCIAGRANSNKKLYNQTLADNNRKIIDWK